MHIPCIIEVDGEARELLNTTIFFPHFVLLFFRQLIQPLCLIPIEKSLRQVKPVKMRGVIFNGKLGVSLPLKVIHYVRVSVIDGGQGRFLRRFYHLGIIEQI